MLQRYDAQQVKCIKFIEFMTIFLVYDCDVNLSKVKSTCITYEIWYFQILNKFLDAGKQVVPLPEQRDTELQMPWCYAYITKRKTSLPHKKSTKSLMS